MTDGMTAEIKDTARPVGLLLKGVGGLYTVQLEDGRRVDCRVCGRFRRERVVPVAGDRVEVSLQADGTGFVQALLPRKNVLVRPPVANMDTLVIVVSAAQPAPNTVVVDKLIAVAEQKEIEPLVVISKADLADTRPLEQTYRTAGLTVFSVSTHHPDSVEPLREALRGRVSAFTGNSGVGKSSLLNVLCPSLQLPAGEISQKLGRGRHTTRSAQLYPLEGGGYVVDTAGFSSLELTQVLPLSPRELPDCFREFAPYVGRCRFTSCVHNKEIGCAVKEAVAAGKIAASRYESYRLLLEEASQKADWERAPRV